MGSTVGGKRALAPWEEQRGIFRYCAVLQSPPVGDFTIEEGGRGRGKNECRKGGAGESVQLSAGKPVQPSALNALICTFCTSCTINIQGIFNPVLCPGFSLRLSCNTLTITVGTWPQVTSHSLEAGAVAGGACFRVGCCVGGHRKIIAVGGGWGKGVKSRAWSANKISAKVQWSAD
jgi:hypothetical protein